MNIVFDFGAVLVNWQPHDVLRKHFPSIANSPETAAQLANSFFAHPDWQAFDAGHVTAQEISALTAKRLNLEQAAVQHMVDAIEDHITRLHLPCKCSKACMPSAAPQITNFISSPTCPPRMHVA